MSSQLYDHFYRCFGCQKEHDAAESAVSCCAVIQEILRCRECGGEYPNAEQLTEHYRLPLSQCEVAQLVESIDRGSLPVQSFGVGSANLSVVK